MSISYEEKKDITIAKGLGIFLVVIGHILARGTSEGNEWYEILTRYIYRFHMPFFMALSGFVFFRPGRAVKLYETYGLFIRKQFVRLIIPFFALGLMVLVGKLVMQNFVHVDNVPQSFVTGLKDLFWTTTMSPSKFIWYIYVLFIYSALSPVLFKHVRNPFFWALLVGMVLQFVPLVYYGYLEMVTPYFVFFMVGGWLRQHEERYVAFISRNRVVIVIVFFASFIIDRIPEFNHGRLIIGLISIPALHAICIALSEVGGSVARFFYVVGTGSLFIYLFNTICIGVSKAALFKVTDWNGTNFLWIAPVLIVSGLVGPMVIEKVYTYGRRILRNDLSNAS